MTAIARLEVIPVHEGSLSTDIANAVEALDEFDVSYETTATDTIIEADSVDEIFAAVQAAHGAVGGDRVVTSLEIDDQRTKEQHIEDRVTAIESALGRPPKREKHA
ncbi:MTH1187 family thiamine-binding protein [Haloarchaeobius sp. HRN-SO-5]|uniref:MTH1187 family thiamine-binding protein n=1 Tax=Haloarchaeobius sp. HRN-SO-5 TaxID=3446118 RepID=UPI003EBBEBC3